MRRVQFKFRKSKRKKRIPGTGVRAFLPLVLLTVLSVWPGMTAGQAYADEIEIDMEAYMMTEDISTTDAEAQSDGFEESDPSGLFVETGEDTVARKGETLDEARAKDDPLYDSSDGGSTVNIGHLYVINGVTVRNSDFPSEPSECWTYANNVYAKIWGHNFLNVFNDNENMLRNLSDEELTLTPEHLKAYVSAAPAGSVLRICDEPFLHSDDGWGHSQVIISHDENGFTVFEGGLSPWPHRREAYYTWTGYCYSGWPGKYHFIKYIKWPGSVPWSEGAQGANAQDLGASRMEQELKELETVLGELIALSGDLIRGEAAPEDLEKVKEALRRVEASRKTEPETETETEAETDSEAES